MKSKIMKIGVMGIIMLIGVMGIIMLIGMVSATTGSFIATGTNQLGTTNSITSFSAQAYNQTWLSFDGINDNVSFPSSVSNNFSTNKNYTFSAWVKRASNDSQYSIYNLGYFTSNGISFSLYKGATSYGLGLINMNDYTYYRLGTISLTDNNWIYMACVYYGFPKNNTICYINGTEGALIGGTFNWSSLKNFSSSVGYMGGNSASYPMNGSIDDFRFYDTSFTDLQIMNLYQSRNNYYTNYSINKTNKGFYSSSLNVINSTLQFIVSNKYLNWSEDGGNTWPKSVQYTPYSGGYGGFFRTSNGTLIVSALGTGNLSISIGNETNFTQKAVFSCRNQSGSLQYGYGAKWSFTEAKNGNLIVGEYGGANTSVMNCSFIYLSTNGGLTWTITYNGTRDYPNAAGKHIHKVATDTYTGNIYASVGDNQPNSRLLRSVDNGTTWAVLENISSSPQSQYLSMAFTPNYRVFATDRSSGNNIVRTADDVNFQNVYTLPISADGYAWDMKRDAKTGYIIASFVSLSAGKTLSLLVSPNEGKNWYSVYEKNGTAVNDGITLITDFDELGYAYYIDENAEKTYYFNFDTNPTKIAGNLFASLNENQGITAYDSSGNGNNGTISGATWSNDGVLNTLTNLVDYTITSSGTFSLVNKNYLYDYILGSWTDLGYTGLSNPNNPFYSAWGFLNGVAGILVMIMLIGALGIMFYYKKMKVEDLVKAIIGVLIGAIVMGVLLNTIS